MTAADAPHVSCALSVPHFGDYADPALLAELARDAETAGWDAVFLWDHILMDVAEPPPQTDAWIALAAMASATERIRLGPMITPLPRRHPWKVARETVALDRLSRGRLVLGVGIGEPADAEYEQFGQDGDARVRAEKLDESLEIVTGLWTGAPFAYRGRHYEVRRSTFLPTPVQRPRIPIWAAGQLPHPRPLRRAARWDGYYPIADNGMRAPTVEEIRTVAADIGRLRGSLEGFALVVGGETAAGPGGRRAVDAYASVGATWWFERISGFRGSLATMRDRVRAGPPTV